MSYGNRFGKYKGKQRIFFGNLMVDYNIDCFTFFLQQPEVNPNPPVTVEICEGSAKIVSENRVFYNPVQQFNRDLSLSVLSTFWKFCQNENEQRKSGKKVPANDFSVYLIDIICKVL